MIGNPHNQINNCRWDNPHTFDDQVNCSNLQTNSLGKDTFAVQCFSLYSSSDLSATIEMPSFQQYKPGDLLAVRLLNWDEITDQDDDDWSLVDPGSLSGGRNHPGHCNGNDDGKCEEDKRGSRKGRGNAKRIKTGKVKGKVTENDKGKVKGKSLE